MRTSIRVAFAFCVLAAVSALALAQSANLIEDGSFEMTKSADQFGLVFQKWSGWKYEGDCEFRVGLLARTGKTSCLLFGGGPCKIRIRVPERELAPGRYKITAFIRGLDIGPGQWNMATEFMFDGKYMQLGKTGAFGWTPLTFVADVAEKEKVEGPSFGLMGTGFFWIDDVSMVKVDSSVPLTESPVLGSEESPVESPITLDAATAVRCGVCGYRNAPGGAACYACGAPLAAAQKGPRGPVIRTITSFEQGESPFAPGDIVAEHATDGNRSLGITSAYTAMETPQNWTGYDYLSVDVYNDTEDVKEFSIEVRDDKTAGYWTRVNYITIAPPGASTIIMPTAIYVGEKSRPGRMLDKTKITRLVFGIGEGAPVYIDNVRLIRDIAAAKAVFPGLYAFDLGTEMSPLMEGFTRISPATLYSKGRGYGLKDAKVWRAFDVLQPEPLYEDFICIESGGLAVDVPNGTYHVFINIDNPSGYWGEYQKYRTRSITAEGRAVVTDTMDLDTFKAKYYRYWNVEDSPADDTFAKYQEPYYDEKEFDVDVDDGQLNIDFSGSDWSVSASAVVIYPAAQSAEGRKFLDYVTAKRRFHFDNYFKRILHKPTGGGYAPVEHDKLRGFVAFARDYMQDIYYNDQPSGGEVLTRAAGQLHAPLTGSAFAGEQEPMTFAIAPLEDLGKVKVYVGDLASPTAHIPAANISVAVVSNRLSRVTMEGSVYTISPRLLMPRAEVVMSDGNTRWFWISVRVPENAEPGVYKGKISILPEKVLPRLDANLTDNVWLNTADFIAIPVEFTVHRGTLDALDVPAGPWGYTIDLPWFGDADTRAWDDSLAAASLARLREYGFTSFSGMPSMSYRGVADGAPQFDFSVADARMKMARDMGFSMPVTNYTSFGGLDLYYTDNAAMTAAGLTDYSAFIKLVFSAVQAHAEKSGWLPVYWNLGDEPIGDDLTRSAENAAAYKKAFPKGPPFFTAATSFTGSDANDPHFQLARELHAANINTHDEPGINMLHKAGSDWAFYNGGNRWTYGVYMYKAVKEFDMKFRLAWHWNNVAGDPYYALDCREDDYAWCNTAPDGTLLPSTQFERLREGLDDYRRLLTLARLADEKKGTAPAAAAKDFIAKRMGAFELGRRDHDALFGAADWQDFRSEADALIDSLR